jgi:hypothetical protein
MGPKLAVVGNGYWGRNLVRNFHALGVLDVGEASFASQDSCT